MSPEKPRFSIIMPTFNQAEFILKSIGTVLNQDYPNWELIIIDNSSDDGTPALLANIQDSRIRIISCHNEGIIARSRNLGIRNSSNPWIAFLDSDDLWEPRKLSSIARIIQKANPDVIYHRMRYVSRDVPGKRMKSRKLRKNAFIDLLTNGNPIANSSVVVRKSALTKVGLISELKELVGSEDFNTWLRIAKLKFNFYFCRRTLGGYRIHEKSYSVSAQKPVHLNATKEFISDVPVRVKTRMDGNNSYLMARYFERDDEYSKAVENYKITIKSGRFMLRAKASLILIRGLLRQW